MKLTIALAATSLMLLGFVLVPNDEVRTEIHCKHFYGGIPYGMPACNDLIIRDTYALSNNDRTKFADWVAYKLDVNTITGEKKPRNWRKDPWLDNDETLEPSPNNGDYDKAWGEINVDRGHQAPLASFDGHDDWYEVNYFSNITPQKSALNQGPWKRLEDKVRKMVELYEEVYVMTGPLYERDMPKLPNADEPHVVPSGYWKIVLYENESGFVHATSFIMEQETERRAKIMNHLTTVDEIEKRTGLDFLWTLDPKKEQAIEKNLGKDWAMMHFCEGDACDQE